MTSAALILDRYGIEGASLHKFQNREQQISKTDIKIALTVKIILKVLENTFRLIALGIMSFYVPHFIVLGGISLSVGAALGFYSGVNSEGKTFLEKFKKEIDLYACYNLRNKITHPVGNLLILGALNTVRVALSYLFPILGMVIEIVDFGSIGFDLSYAMTRSICAKLK